MNYLAVAIIVTFINITASGVHLTQSADTLARYFGYEVSLFVVPPLFGIFTGIVGILITGGFKKNFVRHWWLPTLGALSALTPVGFVMWAMSQPH